MLANCMSRATDSDIRVSLILSSIFRSIKSENSKMNNGEIGISILALMED